MVANLYMGHELLPNTKGKILTPKLEYPCQRQGDTDLDKEMK